MIRFVIQAIGLFLFVIGASAAELRWTYVPTAAYIGDKVSVSFEVPPEITVSIGDQTIDLVSSHPGVWQVHFTMVADRSISVQVADTVYLLECLGNDSMGILAAYSITDGLRSKNGNRVILAAPRLERHKDRRYALMRPFLKAAKPDVTMFWPVEAAFGVSPLLQSLPVWQQKWVRSQDLRDPLFVIDVREEGVAWSPSEFSAIISWIFAQQKPGRPLFVLMPPSDPFRFEALAAVRQGVTDAAHDAAGSIVEFPILNQVEYWQISEGVIGQWLNELGRKQLERELQSNYLGSWNIPQTGWKVETLAP